MIHTLTLNPAIDRILYLKQFEKNVTNRTKSTRNTIGGKGTHVSINLKFLGQDNTAFGICHGRTGDLVIQMLKDYGINVHFNHYKNDGRETRTNYLLIEDSTDCTIVSETGVQLVPQELDKLLEDMKNTIFRGDYLILSGDVSNSSDPSIYNRIMQQFQDLNLRFILDASGQSLKKCIQDKPYMVKPNLDELSTLVGYPVPEKDESIIQAINALNPYDVEIIAVSLGGNGSIIKFQDTFYRVLSPAVHVCNTIGCGDCFLAGFVYGLSQNLPIEETIRIATAISAAAAESNISVGFDRQRAEELKNKVVIYKM